MLCSSTLVAVTMTDVRIDLVSPLKASFKLLSSTKVSSDSWVDGDVPTTSGTNNLDTAAAAAGSNRNFTGTTYS